MVERPATPGVSLDVVRLTWHPFLGFRLFALQRGLIDTDNSRFEIARGWPSGVKRHERDRANAMYRIDLGPVKRWVITFGHTKFLLCVFKKLA